MVHTVSRRRTPRMAEQKSLGTRASSRLPGLAGNLYVNEHGEDASVHHRRIPSLANFAEDKPDEAIIEDIYASAEQSRIKGEGNLLRDVLDISNVLTDGAAAMVDDSFMRCFTSRTAEAWNWNFYLFPCWCLGVVFRYLILFPLRMVLLLLSNAVIVLLLSLVYLLVPRSRTRQQMERRLAQAMCWAFLMSWSAVIRFHGPRPVAAVNRVWVANHTSMVDYAILNSYRPFAVIMQLHGGWIRFIQTYVMSSLGCLWFNRTDIKDRMVVGERMKAHVNDPNAIPLLIFPEGTCVNNEYSVLFKRGAFDMGATVCPIAIKYNKVFVDAFWNSKRLSFGKYLTKIMTSWALVCDVWFLEPQSRQEGETVDAFASRVQRMIADKARLKVVPWDGYLKYYNLGQKNPGLIEKRRKVFAENVKQYLPGGNSEVKGLQGSGGARDGQGQAAGAVKRGKGMPAVAPGGGGA